MTYDPHADFGMYKKIKIHLTLDENRELIPLLSRKEIRYSQASQLRGKLKYYDKGATLMRTQEFKRANVNAHQFETLNDFVMLFSVNKDIEPDGRTYIRVGRKTIIAFGATFQSIEHQGVFYKEFPVTADLKQLEILTVDLDPGRSTVTINAHVPRAFTLIESPVDYAGHITNQIAPIIEALKDIRSKVDIDLYSSSLGQSEILRTMLMMFSNLRIIRGINTDNTRKVRERLIEALIEGDYLAFDLSDIDLNDYISDGILKLPSQLKVRLTESEQSDNDYIPSGNLYEVDGAYWKDKIAFESALECKDMYRDVPYDEFIQNQKDANRAEYLTQHCTFNERLRSMTRAEIEVRTNPHLGCHLIMTEDEQNVYFDYEKENNLQGMRRIELQAIDRWEAFNAKE
jgi:hypothetical protein